MTTTPTTPEPQTKTQRQAIDMMKWANGTCENGHNNRPEAKFCAQCGVQLPPPPPASGRTLGDPSTWAGPNPDQSQVHPSLFLRRPVLNDPYHDPSQPETESFEGSLPPDDRFRPQVMFLWLWWFIFSPVVLFLAPSYAKKAKAMGFKNAQGRPQTARYWWPFWLTLIGYAAIAALIIWMVVAANNVRSSYSSYSSSYTPYTAPTTTQQPYSSSSGYPYFSVTQASGNSELMAVAIEADASNYWTNNSTGATLMTSTAVCEPNTDAVSWQFNCNITFANGGTGSYWVSWSSNTVNGEYEAARRTS